MTWWRSANVRWLVPVAVAAVVASGAALSSARAVTSPDLPATTPQALLARVASARVDALSGTVQSTARLGLPALPTGGAADWTSLVAGTQTLRVFADGPTRQRVDLLSGLTQGSLVRDGATVWTWASSTRQVTRVNLPAHEPAGATPATPSTAPLTPQQLAARALQAVGPTTTVSVGRPASVAGRPAYDLTLQPRQGATLVRSVHILVDAGTGLVLRTQVYAKGQTDAAVDVRFTKLSLKTPAASTFRFTPPPGARVRTVNLRAPSEADTTRVRDALSGSQTYGTGWASVLELSGLPVANRHRGAADGAQAAGPGPLAALLASAQRVQGPFGAGRLVRSGLVSLLVTDSGRVFVGAVTPQHLLSVARAAKPAVVAR